MMRQLFFICVLVTVVLAAFVVAEVEENDADLDELLDFQDLLAEYKRGRSTGRRLREQCLEYGDVCKVNFIGAHDCCRKFGCYGPGGKACSKNKGCRCQRYQQVSFLKHWRSPTTKPASPALMLDVHNWSFYSLDCVSWYKKKIIRFKNIKEIVYYIFGLFPSVYVNACVLIYVLFNFCSFEWLKILWLSTKLKANKWIM